MTPAIKQLQQLRQVFDVLSYETAGTPESGWGSEVVDKLSLPIEQVFKTLVVEASNRELFVALVAVSARLNLKRLAKACGQKKVTMAAPQKVQATTGYVLGGVSPFGQKKSLQTIIDIRAMQFDTVYVSGGKRGIELAVSPNVLKSCLDVTVADIAD